MKQYNPGTLRENHSLLTYVMDYLAGVSLARQSINRHLFKLLTTRSGIALDIGGGHGLQVGAPCNLTVLNVDIENRPSNDITSDASCLPIASEQIDMVMCISVLEHSTNPSSILKEAARVLKPGGVLFLSVPWMYESHMEPVDYLRFSSEKVRQMIHECDLTILKTDETNGWFGWVAHAMQQRPAFRLTLGTVMAMLSYFQAPYARYSTQITVIAQKQGESAIGRRGISQILACPACHASITAIQAIGANCPHCDAQFQFQLEGQFNCQRV